MCNTELLVLVKENKTWEEALIHCRALEAKDPNLPVTAEGNHKYDLATLLTDDDHKFAQGKARSATTDKVDIQSFMLPRHDLSVVNMSLLVVTGLDRPTVPGW